MDNSKLLHYPRNRRSRKIRGARVGATAVHSTWKKAFTLLARLGKKGIDALLLKLPLLDSCEIESSPGVFNITREITIRILPEKLQNPLRCKPCT